MTAFAPINAPRRALLHPAWLGSLALLALNDHVLKGSGLLPSSMTGKLSDFAGLMVAPLLLAAILRLEGRRSWWGAHIAIGAVFSGIQLSPAFADIWSAVMGAVGFPWTITCDPTDLVALPMLLLSAWLFPRATTASTLRLMRRNVEVAAASVGLFFCVATSPGPGPLASSIWADVWVHNSNDYPVVVRVRPLRASVDLDCDAVATDPAGLLGERLFDDATSWTLEPDANMVLATQLETGEFGWGDVTRPDRACHAYLLDIDNVAPTVVFWMTGSLPSQSVDGLGLDRELHGYIEVLHDDDGPGRLEAGDEILFEVPAPTPPEGGRCAPAEEARRLAWSEDLPAGDWLLGAVRPGPDGCVELELETGFEAQEGLEGVRTYLCVPEGAFPFVTGDAIRISREAFGQTLLGDVSAVRLEQIDAELGTVLEAGKVLIASSGQGIADLLGATATHPSLPDCGFVAEPSCGTVSRASRVTLSGGEVSTVQLSADIPFVELPGRSGGLIQFYLVHAQQDFVLDAECGRGPGMLGPDVDIVAVRRPTE